MTKNNTPPSLVNQIMSLNYLEISPPQKIDNLIVFIHGYGASGTDLMNLAPYFQKHLNNVHFITPNAPFKNEMMDNSYYWFPLETFDEQYLLDGVNSTIPVIDKFIQFLIKKYKIDYKQIILCGFSQGTLLAIHYALAIKHNLKAIIGFSGGALPSLLNNINNSTPTCLIHGMDDQVLPATYSLNTAEILKQNQHNFDIKIISGLEHSINKEGLDFAIEFILNYGKYYVMLPSNLSNTICN